MAYHRTQHGPSHPVPPSPSPLVHPRSHESVPFYSSLPPPPATMHSFAGQNNAGFGPPGTVQWPSFNPNAGFSMHGIARGSPVGTAEGYSDHLAGNCAYHVSVMSPAVDPGIYGNAFGLPSLPTVSGGTWGGDGKDALLGAGMNEHQSVQEGGINVKELARSLTQIEADVNLKETVSRIRAFASKAENTIHEIQKLVMQASPISNSRLIACPCNRVHHVPPEALFHHFLRCVSGPNSGKEVDALLSALKYRRTVQADYYSHSPGQLELPQNSIEAESNSKLPKTDISTDQLHVRESLSTRLENAMKMRDAGDLSYWSNQLDLFGCGFFYRDAPGVVHAVIPSPSGVSSLELGRESCNSYESLLIDEGLEMVLTGSTSSTDDHTRPTYAPGQDLRRHLPSRFWLLLKEVEAWRDFPNECSSVVLEAASDVARIRHADVTKWLLENSPSLGIILDSAMAHHVCCLVGFCLKAIQRESDILVKQDVAVNRGEGADCKHKEHELEEQDISIKLTTEDSRCSDEGSKITKIFFVDCLVLTKSLKWLASQLIPLYGPGKSQALILLLLKHALISSGRRLASQFVGLCSNGVVHSHKMVGLSHSDEGLQEFPVPAEGERKIFRPPEMNSVGVTITDVIPGADGTGPCELMEGKIEQEAVNNEGSQSLLDEDIEFWQMKAALDALKERTMLENYLKTMFYHKNATKLQMMQEHDFVVKLAAEQRANRSNFRAVSEYDGLIWHRSQLQDKNKSKTREEILAEERDYKRRRMSYRGKKIRRTPTQVLHDIITGHMEEIVATGGIGVKGDRCASDYDQDSGRHGSNHIQDRRYGNDHIPDSRYVNDHIKDSKSGSDHTKDDRYNSDDIKDGRYRSDHIKDSRYNNDNITDSRYNSHNIKDSRYDRDHINEAQYKCDQVTDSRYGSVHITDTRYGKDHITDSRSGIDHIKGGRYRIDPMKDNRYGIDRVKESRRSHDRSKTGGNKDYNHSGVTAEGGIDRFQPSDEQRQKYRPGHK